MNNYRLSTKADADFEAIYRYSIITFGEEQADHYALRLINAFELIVENPDIGTAFPQLAGIRRFVHDAHVIYYSTEEDVVIILRVLGARQDPGRHLE